jgi:hypothetical protein
MSTNALWWLSIFSKKWKGKNRITKLRLLMLGATCYMVKKILSPTKKLIQKKSHILQNVWG